MTTMFNASEPSSAGIGQAQLSGSVDNQILKRQPVAVSDPVRRDHITGKYDLGIIILHQEITQYRE